MVFAHVLQEADVDLGRPHVVRRVSDQPADHAGDQGTGDEQDDDVRRALPPGQHDLVAGVVVVVDDHRFGGVDRLIGHPGSLPTGSWPTATVRFRYRPDDDDPAMPITHRGGEPVTLVDVQEVTVRFGGIVALDSLTFGIEAGHICGLIGPNGAGKTTMFNVVSRIYEPTSGRVTYDGQDLLAVPAHEIASLGIARTFQNLALFPSMSLLENVMVGAHSQGDGRGGPGDQPHRCGRREPAHPRLRRRPAGPARPRPADVPAGRRPAVRHAQTPGDRQGARRQAAVLADGRAGVGTHPRGGRRARRDDRQDPRRVRPHRACSSSTTCRW